MILRTLMIVCLCAAFFHAISAGAQEDAGSSSGLAAATAAETASPGHPVIPPAHHHRIHRTRSGNSATDVEHANMRCRLIKSAIIHSKPSSIGITLAAGRKGDLVHVTGSTRDYYRIKLSDGRLGYIPHGAVEITKPVDQTFELTVAATALSEPNKWGKKVFGLHKGENLHVVGMALDYLKVRTSDGKEGYVPMKAFE